MSLITSKPLGQHWVKYDRKVYGKYDPEWVSIYLEATNTSPKIRLILCQAYECFDMGTEKHWHGFEPVKRGTLTVLTADNILED